MTRIAQVYKHAATNKNLLDLNPSNRKLALDGIIPSQIQVDPFEIEHDKETKSHFRQKCYFGPTV